MQVREQFFAYIAVSDAIRLKNAEKPEKMTFIYRKNAILFDFDLLRVYDIKTMFK